MQCDGKQANSLQALQVQQMRHDRHEALGYQAGGEAFQQHDLRGADSQVG